MTGEALLTTHQHVQNEAGTAAGAEAAPWTRFPTALDLFASVLLLRPWDPSDRQLTGLVARARSEARTAVSNGRASVDEHADLRLLYEGARAQASFVPLSPIPLHGSTRWERTFSALGTLRHRQRAALSLYYLAGLAMPEVARIMGQRETEIRKVIEAGIANVVRVMGEPVDVRRSLRTAGARLLVPAAEAPQQAPAVPRMPRSVVRTLLAEPVSVEEVPADLLAGAVIGSPPAAPSLMPPLPPEGSEALIHELRARVARRIEEDGVDDRPLEEMWLRGLPPAARVSSPPPVHHEPELRVIHRPAPEPAPVPTTPRRSLLALAAAIVLVVAATLVPAVAGSRDPVAPPQRVGATVAAEAPTLAAPVPVVEVVPQFRVRAGDSLWSIAQRQLGDPLRWREIWALNKGRIMPGGQRFGQPGLIRPGWGLVLPKG